MIVKDATGREIFLGDVVEWDDLIWQVEHIWVSGDVDLISMDVDQYRETIPAGLVIVQ